MEPKFFTAEEAARFSNLSAGHLANLRAKKRGSKYYKRGAKVLYDRIEFEQWIRSTPVLTIDSVSADR